MYVPIEQELKEHIALMERPLMFSKGTCPGPRFPGLKKLLLPFVAPWVRSVSVSVSVSISVFRDRDRVRDRVRR